MMLGLLLARAGVKVTMMEKHAHISKIMDAEQVNSR
jgi:2-polyprenyl-6-methoxyphenol hydroxylase-like FAD-dependent oxidoreductase